ncbi:MAG: FadR family transcriptional regulator [Desulfobacteraceae bacterium]|nr:MAG: FadR family transcriptional regulator [Desulfobacteraceae bacterium]
MAILQKAKNLSLVEDVTRQIENAILAGDYKPGDKLPSTRELQTIFGASLGTIRESLAILEQKSLLDVKKGAKGGFFIKELTTRPMESSLELLMRHAMISHRELYEFRTNIEAGIMRLVVQRATDADIDLLKEYLGKLHGCKGNGSSGWVNLIHIENNIRKEFLRIIQNRTYEIVLMPIIRNLQQYARQHLPGGNPEIELACRYWDDIVPAISERNEHKAAKLIKELLYQFMDMMIQRGQTSQ